MPGVAILTDSSAYLPADVIKPLPVFVIPLKLLYQGKTYLDGVDIQANEFYTMLDKSEDMPSTSQIGVQEYETMFRKLLDEGYQVLTMGISSGISGSFQSALQAKEAFRHDPVEVIDSKLVSMALGFQVLTTARAAMDGASLAECKELALKAYDHIGVHFTVDTLKYLHKGGRIGSAKRLLGTALNIKPILQIRDGKIELVESVISRRKAVERLLQLTENAIGGRKPVRISVFDALVNEEADALQKRAQDYFGAVEGIRSSVSPVVGSHTGPGTLSLAFMAGL